ncbi:vacuolar protein sorting-associated protein 37A isoform X1 [Harmonia axyridis]|uniref:vacuolar protein sorting-associated protein 37A isoform X1 n=1 Tax=Harmonia axyridis TaxID=115357 RepID=UPI001E2793B2|nr:vacuolar protein sorting-associated protein 37A isoform X1 [Harmonia axyridis]
MVYVMLPRIHRSEAELRKQQINTLKIFNANVTELTEGIEYQIDFHAGDNDFKLIVSLGNEFPNDKPLLKIIPIVVHPWVNHEGDITTAPGLLNFTLHSDLGRVVQAVIREFERNPPPITSEHGGNTVTSPSTSVKESEITSPGYLMNFPTSSNFSPPSQMIASSSMSLLQGNYFPELNKLTIKELKSLNESIDKQEDFILELTQPKEQNRLIDELILHVEDLADSNLSKQEQLEMLRKGIEYRIEEATDQTFKTEKLHNDYKNLCEKFSPKNIQEHLRLASRKADEDSEQLAEQFLNGEMDVDRFLSLYIRNRTKYQTRKIKEEKLSQQIDSLEKAGF